MIYSKLVSYETVAHSSEERSSGSFAQVVTNSVWSLMKSLRDPEGEGRTQSNGLEIP